MHILGIVISFCAFLLGGLLILRGAVSRLISVFPLFYSYIIYCFCGFLGMYLIYWLDRQVYPSAYWIYYLVSILVEFTVLVEISDQIFRPYHAIRNLGRALTIVISIVLGFVYILPAILGSTPRRPALFDFALRACVTKVVILVVLFYMARHYGSELGRNVGGLMFGFSIYLAMNIAMLSAGKAFEPALRDPILWVMSPLASVLCVLVWTISLWELAPMPDRRATSTAAGRDPEAVALELTRFDSELSKILHK